MPNLHPDITRVHSILTTRWGRSGYKPLPVTRIESYYVDTALDNDADTWSIDVGDPRAQLIPLFDRDNEVRSQLFGVGREANHFIMSGLADEISYDESLTVTLTGRDLSAIAIDSACPPGWFELARAWAIVGRQAREIGFRRMSLGRAGQVRKKQYTDGSETYWEFWYRLYRKEKMWIWTDPNGTLIAGRLNYENNPTYFFGVPRGDEPTAIRRSYIPVEHAEMRKSTQQRVEEVIVYGHRGDVGFISVAKDPTMRSWIKKPKKILVDTEAHTIKGAQRMAWEEIFEGKVGSLEIKLTIPDPGFPIRTNRVARVRIPEMKLFGDYFIVGTRIQGGSAGFIQEIRLRQKQYSLTRRVPTDPKIDSGKTEEPRTTATTTSLAEGIAGLRDVPEAWGSYFVKAAKEFHGPWDFKLFLATLLGICFVETDFRNIRQNGGPGGDHHEWEPPPAGAAVQGSHGEGGTSESQRQQWRIRFANEAGDGIVGKNYGVGPMQLTELLLKQNADDRFKKGFRDEFQGGRWHPEHNIWISAKYLRQCLQGTVADSGRDIDMWMGVMAYNKGVQGAQDYFNTFNKISPYAQKVKVAVYNEPGYLTGVGGAIQAAREASTNAQDGQTDGQTGDGDWNPKEFPTKAQILHQFKTAMFPPSRTEQRQLIMAAAMWGYYNKDAMHYAHPSNPAQSAKRMKDFGPPPNVPEWSDCSSFATWCYKVAGAVDPNGNNYNGSGYTGTLWNHGRKVSVAQLRAGDLCFYGNPASVNSHVTVYVGLGKVVSHGSEEGPFVTDVKYRSDFTGCVTYFADDKDVPATSGGGGGSPGSSGGKRSVVIQAGHNTGSHSDQPYGHSGQSGASGEVAFTTAIRDALVTTLAADNRFNVESGSAWTGSAGASAAPGDDVNSKSDVFIAIHAYRDTGLSGYFFGWPSARGEAVIASSKKLRDSIVGRWTFSGAPARNSSRDQQLETYYGYYAWGHPSRKFPDNVDHTAGTKARLLIECGHLGTDGITTHQTQIARALYEGICDYFNLTPNP